MQIFRLEIFFFVSFSFYTIVPLETKKTKTMESLENKKLIINAVENFLKNSNWEPYKKTEQVEKKEIVNIKLNRNEINLISEAIENLYNDTIGEMLYNKEDNLRNLLDKFTKL